jgi:hypothetical protein
MVFLGCVQNASQHLRQTEVGFGSKQALDSVDKLGIRRFYIFDAERAITSKHLDEHARMEQSVVIIDLH